MKATIILLLAAFGLTAYAALPTADMMPSLPFARAQDIPYAGAAVQAKSCPDGSRGLQIITADNAYAIMLHGHRGIIADNHEGDKTPVWFVEITEAREFRLLFTLPYGEATARYPDPCTFLAPTKEKGGELL